MNSMLIQNGTTLVTGASGYLGGLIIESMLRETQQDLILLARKEQNLQDIIAPIRIERISKGQDLTQKDIDRLSILNYDGIDSLLDIKNSLQKNLVMEIVHSAGCVDYYDIEKLELVNVKMTKILLELADELKMTRFVFISTAYSSGYKDVCAEEFLHENPKSDPTDYTRSKRKAEFLVSQCAVPSLIIRPSIVIGDSGTGRYGGKRYGLYQQWMGLERLLCDRFHEEIHVVATDAPVNFLHQDSFQQGFIGAYQNLAAPSIIHLVSKTQTAPSMRDLWETWIEQVARPHRVYFYAKLSDVPLKMIHPRQRAYLMFASVNLEIAAHFWDFSTENLDRLRRKNVEFVDATLSSISLCQSRFIQSSQKIQDFKKKYSNEMRSSPQVIEVESTELDQVS